MNATTTHMSEADYETVLTAAAELGRTEPGLDGPDMFKRLGLLPADHNGTLHDGSFLTPVIKKLSKNRRAFAIRRAYLNIDI